MTARKVEPAERTANLARPTTVQVDGRVEVDGPTRDFLLSLGWTPPAEA